MRKLIIPLVVLIIKGNQIYSMSKEMDDLVDAFARLSINDSIMDPLLDLKEFPKKVMIEFRNSRIDKTQLTFNLQFSAERSGAVYMSSTSQELINPRAILDKFLEIFYGKLVLDLKKETLCDRSIRVETDQDFGANRISIFLGELELFSLRVMTSKGAKSIFLIIALSNGDKWTNEDDLPLFSLDAVERFKMRKQG